ncbi:hypothetical protein [Novosphingobium sp. CECT 9465]|uniref:hypothetical protein n=1 Tax=Novosphingobium sp. CECT 9465 TaxID=2829794 RepID=UPI001E4A3E89|nr:hypothetical protein [Novosphingobium sp. CECT 9465]CAH0498427.1 hypothetical protein NVSP9465_03514 [Novosphingobium sp. CECT 9465]
MRGYRFQTRRGPVFILAHQGRWIIMYDNENLGSYHSPMAAADDASGGHTYSPSNGVDLGSLNIPDDIGEWDAI